MVRTFALEVGEDLSARAPSAWCYRGRRVRLADGTTLGLADTPANQATFPQSRSHARGLGHPLCRLVGLVCLGSGALRNAAIGRYHGKGGDA